MLVFSARCNGACWAQRQTGLFAVLHSSWQHSGNKRAFFSLALFPIRVDNLQQGAAFHFTKYAAFFEKWRGVRGEEKNFGADVRLFHVKKSFSPFPGSHLPLSGTARSEKTKSPICLNSAILPASVFFACIEEKSRICRSGCKRGAAFQKLTLQNFSSF